VLLELELPDVNDCELEVLADRLVLELFNDELLLDELFTEDSDVRDWLVVDLLVLVVLNEVSVSDGELEVLWLVEVLELSEQLDSLRSSHDDTRSVPDWCAIELLVVNRITVGTRATDAM
jgi:hypothetical protein